LEQIELNASIRKATGNGPARVLRREGRVPAVLYGPKTDPVLLSVNRQELDRVLKKGGFGQMLLRLVIQNGNTETKTTMIKELQTDPVSHNCLHIDFYEVDLTRKILVKVSLVAKGKAKGIEDGGMLQLVRRELEVLCLPTQIPETLEIDITELDIGDSLHVEDIPLPEGIEIPADMNFTILTIVSGKMAEEAVAEAEVTEEGVGEEPAEVAEDTEEQ
jgi:large subunit ribosomal protein L25